jgi:hypothetical protein
MPPGAVAPVQPAENHHPSPDICVWPIGALVAVHWVSHHAGPEPDAMGVIAASNLGLIELGNEWRATERGRIALHEHGWL